MRQLKFIALSLLVLSLVVFYGARAATSVTKPVAKPNVVKSVVKPAVKPAVNGVKTVVKNPLVKAPTFVIKSATEIKKLAEIFIKNNLISSETKLKLSNARDFNPGLYELDVFLNDSVDAIKIYVTKDGKLFFPQSMDLVADVVKKPDQASSPVTEPATVKINKADKPVVELFVMSHCPFGTQIEKGLLPVYELLGSKIDLQLKFVDYAMHGGKELNEELTQYCIGKIKPEKFWPYLKCFLADENGSEKCLIQTGINPSSLINCVTETDTKYNIIAGAKNGGNYPAFNIYKADNEKYGVQGSPTLVINGTTVSVNRSPSALLKAICDSFTNKPAECSAVLSSETPAVGFGFSAVASSNTVASCH